MNKTKKIIAVLVVCVCLALQLVAISGAAESGTFNVSLPNWQTKVLLFKGTKTDDVKKAYVTLTGGTANYVYVQMTSQKTGNEFTDWAQIPNDGVRYSISYKLQPNKNKAVLLATGYQKNVLSKTAAGKIVL